MQAENSAVDGSGRPPARGRRVVDLAAGERRRVILIAVARSFVVAAALIWLYYLLSFEWSPGTQIVFGALAATLLIAGAGVWQVRSVVRADLPQVRALEALAFSATLLLVLFAGVYLSLSNDDPAAFSEPLSHTGSLYFALTTLSTVGFGDIAARSDGARVTVMVQMVADIVVLGVLVKLIVAIVRRRTTPGRD